MNYEYTEKEREKVLVTFMNNKKVKQIPASEKKKYILLKEIIKNFTEEKIYSEKEVNDELRKVFSENDYIEQRRNLIIFKLLTRTADGSQYWVEK